MNLPGSGVGGFKSLAGGEPVYIQEAGETISYMARAYHRLATVGEIAVLNTEDCSHEMNQSPAPPSADQAKNANHVAVELHFG